MKCITRLSVAFLLVLLASESCQRKDDMLIFEYLKAKQQDLMKYYGEALEAIFGIGIRVQALLDDPTVNTNNNFLISPLSIALLVGQLMLGSEGHFTDELYRLLSLPKNNIHKATSVSYKKNNVTYLLPYGRLHLQLGSLMQDLQGKNFSRSFTLKAANALFYSTSLKLKDEFTKHLEIYSTQIKPLDFASDPVGSQKAINEWAANNTNGVIDKVLPAPLPTTATAILTNAIYFKAEWETPFSNETNRMGPFHTTKNTTVEVEYMTGFFEEIPFAKSEKLNCRIVALPYKMRELAMYFILPDPDDEDAYNIGKFAERLNPADVLELVSQMKSSSVNIQVPKMKLSNSLSILRPLQRYHLFVNQMKEENTTGNIFDYIRKRLKEFESFNATEEVDILLTAAAEEKPLRLTNLIQEMTLSVNEKGTEAAAVSLSIIEYMGGNKVINLDRPFVFFIRHEITSAVLFWGTINNPTMSQ